MAAISNEKVDNFTWVLTMLKTMLDNCMMPRVILTDCDLALMNACEIVFPNAVKLLCRWHINENIKKHCRQSFATAEEYEQFLSRWNWLVKSSTLAEYKSRYKRLYDTLIADHKRVLDYVNINWLNKYKEKFMSVWKDQNLNFGNTTTNRVESAHSFIKKHMVTWNSMLDKLVGIIDQIMVSQLTAIKATFEESRKKKMNHHNIPFFNELRRHVSCKALDILWGELNWVNKLMEFGRTCRCHVRTSCGMPCACMISKYLTSDQTIPLDSADIYWRKLDFDPLFVDKDEGLDSKANELVEEFV
ncbi:uncharacterized protein LOC143530314 [Bidens hawaiensis]|uniref:uncharacterized protein LOC143530314 n=1 Tax=Bidens hawaiensis TaxID=980011 RepID=UPI00404B4C39